jgi:hypothetical protein
MYAPVLVGSLYSPSAMAARNAVVTSEKAVIWADAQRRAPLGYARRGKVLRVGEKERSKGQVITVIVSGKLAYISTEDVALEDDIKAKEIDNETTRFIEATKEVFAKTLHFSTTQFSAIESKNSKADRPGDTWTFQGGQLKGVAQKPDSVVGVAFLFDYLYAQQTVAGQDETLRIFDFGVGPTLTLLDFKHLMLRIEMLVVVVPWMQYEAPPLFILNSYGAGGAGQASLMIYPTESWGLEVAAGVKAIKIYKIKRETRTRSFEDFDPLFVGAQVSAGLVYRF